MLVQVPVCQNGRSPDTDRSDMSQDSPERINERLSDFSDRSDTNKRIRTIAVRPVRTVLKLLSNAPGVSDAQSDQPGSLRRHTHTHTHMEAWLPRDAAVTSSSRLDHVTRHGGGGGGDL